MEGADPWGLDPICISNPDHYGLHWGVVYDHRSYTVDIPHGQNVDVNIANAIRQSQLIEGSLANLCQQNLAKYAYLNANCSNWSVGDYGKNFKLYPDPHDHILTWQRRLGANFNFGAMGAALGYDLNTLLAAGHSLSLWHKSGYHPQIEQDAIEDGYWYYYQHHPSAGVQVPTGASFR